MTFTQEEGELKDGFGTVIHSADARCGEQVPGMRRGGPAMTREKLIELHREVRSAREAQWKAQELANDLERKGNELSRRYREAKEEFFASIVAEADQL
jgi:hypothetical protein